MGQSIGGRSGYPIGDGSLPFRVGSCTYARLRSGSESDISLHRMLHRTASSRLPVLRCS